MFALSPLFTHKMHKLLTITLTLGLLLGLSSFFYGHRADAKAFVGATSPTWSPDGQHIAFLKSAFGTDGSSSDLYVVNANGSEAVKLMSGMIYSPVWSPDGKQIAVERTYLNADQQYVSTGLDLVNVASGTVISLTKDGNSATWSADGKQVYFVPTDGRLYVVRTDGSGLQAVLPTNVPTIYGYALSPDGKHLVIVHQGPSQNPDDFVYYVAGIDGSGFHQIDTGGVGVAAWSPDGLHLVIISNCGGHGGLCLFNTDGSGMHSLVEDRASTDWDASLAWSPNGKWIAYIHLHQIVIIGPDGSYRTMLTPTIGANGNEAVFSPSWSPDSQHIVFQAQYVVTRISGDPMMIAEIYMVDTSGMNMTVLQGLDTLP